jgi:hypothetical protein
MKINKYYSGLVILILTGLVVSLTNTPYRSQSKINSSQAVTKVLVVDWLEDPWIEKFREDIDPITPGVQNPLFMHPLNNTRETLL